MKTRPMRVNWASDQDLQCAILGAMGFSTRFIGEQTGLSPCQISYRLSKGRIKRADYRNGESEMAQRVMDQVAPKSGKVIRETLNLEGK